MPRTTEAPYTCFIWKFAHELLIVAYLIAIQRVTLLPHENCISYLQQFCSNLFVHIIFFCDRHSQGPQTAKCLAKHKQLKQKHHDSDIFHMHVFDYTLYAEGAMQMVWKWILEFTNCRHGCTSSHTWRDHKFVRWSDYKSFTPPPRMTMTITPEAVGNERAEKQK